MRTIYLITILLVAAALTGCAGVDPERPAIDAVTGAGVGGLTYEVTKSPLIAAGAGAGGVLVADVAQQMAANGDKAKLGQAYMKGQSDSIKELYWAKQRDKAVANTAAADANTKTTLYPIVIPAGVKDGVSYEQQTVYLPVQESSKQ